jgi:hypothetical protein
VHNEHNCTVTIPAPDDGHQQPSELMISTVLNLVLNTLNITGHHSIKDWTVEVGGARPVLIGLSVVKPSRPQFVREVRLPTGSPTAENGEI